MNKLLCSGLTILLGAYVALGVASQSAATTEPLVFVNKPEMPIVIGIEQPIVLIYKIKNEVDDPSTTLPIYPSITPGTSHITRINIGESGDCGPSGTHLKGGHKCTLTYQIAAFNAPQTIKQTLSIDYKGRYPLTSNIDLNIVSGWQQTSNIPGYAYTWALALDVNTQTLFAGNVVGTPNVFSLDLTNPLAAWQNVGSLNSPVTSLLYDSQNNILYAGLDDGSGVYYFDFSQTNPSWTQVGNNSPGKSIVGLVLDSETSTLYASEINSNWVQSIDLTLSDVAWQLAGNNAPASGAYGLTLNTDTRILYAGTNNDGCPSQSGNGVYSLEIDNPNANWTQIGNGTPGNGQVAPLLLNPTGGQLYAGLDGNTNSTGGVYNLNLNSNTATWQSVGTAPTPLPGNSLVQSLLTSNNFLYAGTGSGFCYNFPYHAPGAGVWLTDITGSQPWSLITNVGFPSNTPDNSGLIPPTPSLVLNPKTNILYAATFSGVFQIQQ